MTNLQAALGLHQIARMPEIVARKREVATMYQQRLRAIEALQLQHEEPWAKSVYWMCGVVVRDEVPFDAAELAERLSKRGVETRPFFLGMHEQPALHDLGIARGVSLPVTERIARRGLYLPSSTTLTESQIDRVCDAVREALR